MTKVSQPNIKNQLEELEVELLLGNAATVLDELNKLKISKIVEKDHELWTDDDARLVLLAAIASKDVFKFEISYTYTQNVLKYFNRQADQHLSFKGDCELNLTSINKHNGIISSALDHIDKAQSYYEQANDKYKIAKVILYRGIIFMNLGLYQKALGFVEQSIELLENLKNEGDYKPELIDVAFASSFHIKGVILLDDQEHKDKKEVMICFDKAMKLVTQPAEIISKKMQAYLFFDIGRYKMVHDSSSPDAIKNLEKSKEIRNILGDVIGVANCEIWLSKLTLKDNPTQVIKTLNELIVKLLTNKSIELRRDAYKVLSEAYYERYLKDDDVSDIKNAFMKLQKFAELHSEIQASKLKLILNLFNDPENTGIDAGEYADHNNIMSIVNSFYQTNESSISNIIHSKNKNRKIRAIVKLKSNNEEIREYVSGLNDLLSIVDAEVTNNIDSFHCSAVWNGSNQQLRTLFDILVDANLIEGGINRDQQFKCFSWHLNGGKKDEYQDSLIWITENVQSLVLLYHLLLEGKLLKAELFEVYPFKRMYSNWKKKNGPFKPNAFSMAASAKGLFNAKAEDEGTDLFETIENYSSIHKAVQNAIRIINK